LSFIADWPRSGGIVSQGLRIRLSGSARDDVREFLTWQRSANLIDLEAMAFSGHDGSAPDQNRVLRTTATATRLHQENYVPGQQRRNW
jgi:hypothetical protein